MGEEKRINSDEIKKLSPIEAYWKGRYEESEKEREDLLELLRTQIFHSSTAELTRGSIGAGSTVIYGFDPTSIGIAVGIGGITFVIASLILTLTHSIALALSAVGIAIAILSKRGEKRHTYPTP